MHTSSKVSIFKEVPSLKLLKDSELNLLASISTHKKMNKGKFIYEEGSLKKYVYLLVKGSIKLGSNTNDGRTLIKNVVHENALFGINIFAGDDKRREFAQGITDVSYYEIPAEYFQKLTTVNSEFAQYTLELIINRLQALEERMHSFVFRNAKERIVDFIKSTGKNRGIRIGIDETLINHGMSHKEIAFLTDTSRQTVARVLGELKRANLIHFSPRKPNKILIRNLSALG